jgi:type I restriction enzyme, S subunit
MPDDELPTGWVKTTLGEVCALNPKPSFDDASDDTEVSFVPMAAVEEESGRLDASTIRTLGAVRRGYTPFRENDVIFAKITPCMENGKIALATGLRNRLGYGSTEFLVLRPYPGLLPRFLLNFLLRHSVRERAERQMSGAVGQKRVPASYLRAHEFPLPPTNEQHRIVAKLDAALSRLERAEAIIRRAQGRVQRYRISVLHDAVAGNLSDAWRHSRALSEAPTADTAPARLQRLLAERRSRREDLESQRLLALRKKFDGDTWRDRFSEPTKPTTVGLPRLPKDWTWISIDQISWSSTYGTSTKCSREGKGPAVLRIPNIRHQALDFGDLKFAQTDHGFHEQDFIAPGDLLLVRTNGSRDLIGHAAIATSLPNVRCSFASYLIRLRLLGDEALWAWVSLAWDSDILRANLESRAVTTAGQYNLSLSRLKDLAIPLPPADEMCEIVQEVERRLAASQELAQTLERQLERAQATRESLLEEAFSGQLVPHEPADEPATELLHRIRMACQVDERTPRAKRMSKPKAKSTRRSLLTVLSERNRPISPEDLFREAGFETSEVDLFYRELCSLRDQLLEVKPSGPDAKSWPEDVRVLLQLREVETK